MRKIIVLFLSFAVAFVSYAATSPVKPVPKKASEIMIPIGKAGELISLLDLSEIRIKDFELVSGKDLNAVQTVGFKLAQRDIRKSISPDGTVNKKKLTKVLTRINAGESGFHIGGFALGFLLGLIGILIAYLIKDDYKRNRVKWAWFGLAAVVVLSLLLI
jgi:hypothetical protein